MSEVKRNQVDIKKTVYGFEIKVNNTIWTIMPTLAAAVDQREKMISVHNECVLLDPSRRRPVAYVGEIN